MSVEADTTWTWAFTTAFVFLSLALILTVARLIKGPDLADRVVALDLTAYQVIGFTAVYAVATDHPDLLNVALALGLIAFLGVTAFARYLERTQVTKAESE